MLELDNSLLSLEVNNVIDMYNLKVHKDNESEKAKNG